MAQQGKDWREQLTPIKARLRENLAVIRPVSQVVVRLKPVQGQDRFERTIDDILRWMNNRAGRKLPESAWKRQSFELSDIGAQRTAGVALTEPRYWAARLDDADRNVPLRTWVTEIGVGVDTKGDVLFGSRLICTTRGDEVPYDRSIPSFVRNVLSAGPAELDDVPISMSPRIVATEEDVNWLVDLLERPSRDTDVVVLSLPDGSEDPGETAISSENVCRQTVGTAHIVVLTGPASYKFTDRVGKELSVYRQSIRTYKPRFQSWIDEPSRHPLALAHRIAVWGQEGARAFERWFINHILWNSVRVADRDERLPGFNTVRQLAAQREREQLKKAGASDAEMLRLYQEDNDRIRNELQEQKEQYDGLLNDADREREDAQQEANVAKTQAFVLRDRIRALQKQLAEREDHTRIPIPATLDGFETWCRENLSGTVEVVNRAFQGVRKSQFHDPTLLYRALLLLRDYYVPMRAEGGIDRKQAFERALAELQLEEASTGEGIRFHPELYSVSYEGQPRSLNRHLKLGNSREPRFCFRLYFFWDDEAQVVIVGWLPSHLDSRLT